MLSVGWTLVFEMFFYLLFAVGLLLPRRRGLPLVLGMIAAFILVGQSGLWLPSEIASLAQPIICLFGLGILLAWLHERPHMRIAPRTGNLLLFLLATASPLQLWAAPAMETQLWFNPEVWAYSLAIVAVGAFTAEQRNAPSRIAAGLLLLGNASYFLYLAHPFVIRVLGEVGARLPLDSVAGQIGLAVTMFVVSMAVGITGHLLVEPRLIQWTAPLFRRSPGAGRAAAGAASA